VRFRAAQTPAQRFLFDLFIERQTAFFAQLFGIIQQFVPEIMRKNDGSRINSPRQTSSSGLITAGLCQFLM
jgi:hypothetical protein